MSTFSPNLQIEEVARNGDIGTWDTPTNNNWTLMDSALGAIATIGLNNTNVILNAAQFQSKTVTFNSTLTGSVTITFPTSFTKSYEIQHLCTGSSAFTITLETTATGGQVICCPPGEIIEVLNDGANLKYKNFGGHIGSYMDWYGSSMPNWNDGCTVPPYINCVGGSFSSASYPVLAARIGTALPDMRGRTRLALDQGTGRNTSVVTGGTILTGGGDQFMQSHSHANTATVNDPTHTHSGVLSPANVSASAGLSGSVPPEYGTPANTAAAATGITVTVNNAGAGSGGAQNLPPLLVHGLTLIRAG
jgi:microcystin-dependent protein